MPDDSLREFVSLRKGGTSCANLSSRNFLLLAAAFADAFEDDDEELELDAVLEVFEVLVVVEEVEEGEEGLER